MHGDGFEKEGIGIREKLQVIQVVIQMLGTNFCCLLVSKEEYINSSS